MTSMWIGVVEVSAAIGIMCMCVSFIHGIWDFADVFDAAFSAALVGICGMIVTFGITVAILLFAKGIVEVLPQETPQTQVEKVQ